MGYTHYWTFKKQKTKALEKLYQLAIKDCQKIVQAYQKEYGSLSGYTAHTKLGEYGGIKFNGSRELGHEDFYLREYLKQNESFNFCKTEHKPYDTVVVACLIILKNRLGDAIDVASDGFRHDWIAGLELARRVTKRKNINLVESIRVRPLLREAGKK